MRKQLTAIAIPLSLALLATACGGNGNGNGNGSAAGGSASPSGSASSPASSGGGQKNEQVTLKFMGWEVSPLETESVKKGIESFMKSNPNIKVEYTTIPGGTQYVAKMQTLVLGNEAPDVFFLQSDYYSDFVKRKSLLDLTDRVQASGIAGDLIDSAVKLSTVDGKYYGIESCIVAPVLYYNKELFDKAGVPYPPSDPAKAWSWPEFVDAAKKLTVKNGDKTEQYGVYGLETYYNTIAEIMSNGGNWFSDDLTKSAANTPEVKEVLQAISDLRKKEGVAPEGKLLTNSGMSASQMLQTGKIAMLVDGSWALQELSNMNFEVGMAVLPKFKEAVTHGQAHLHVASANTKHPDEAWKLIEFLSSEEYQLQNVKAGLWLPNHKSLYSEEGIKKWLTPGVHPDGFEEMIPYFTSSKTYPYALLSSQKIQEDTSAELDKYFLGNQPLDKTVENIESVVNQNLQAQGK
ncbi:sugar ABC transporter substrate-binding protein [Cohnella xylanilytica]|uniref:Sugar ABC transporter substrate-binding protein n=1 Tax=Cohnella xylanilytica TaxID=557555 RepID=A0A841U9J3_9BACL|nr:sugar ABC transporter substrate-binding protein [Cohnella xylanilytica]MBB6694903.1 sugar ABC transporter substrate-binding protein [Cohnella xylanilytica]GIO14360.1 sugar ABC transporter substrate-binding protein [Cohnella xylanilytica]